MTDLEHAERRLRAWQVTSYGDLCHEFRSDLTLVFNDLDRLRTQVGELKRSQAFDRAKVEGLLADLQRLREGDFTEEEFQNLCHNLPARCTRAAFERGCREYQDKLFGPREG